MTPTADDYAEAVSNGAALLDREVPSWRDRIDVAALDMEHGERCVLGTIYGEYIVGLSRLGVRAPSAVTYGFRVTAESDAGWDALRDGWIKELQR